MKVSATKTICKYRKIALTTCCCISIITTNLEDGDSTHSYCSIEIHKNSTQINFVLTAYRNLVKIEGFFYRSSQMNANLRQT